VRTWLEGVASELAELWLRSYSQTDRLLVVVKGWGMGAKCLQERGAAVAAAESREQDQKGERARRWDRQSSESRAMAGCK
jgi:hypothetical protein